MVMLQVDCELINFGQFPFHFLKKLLCIYKSKGSVFESLIRCRLSWNSKSYYFHIVIRFHKIVESFYFIFVRVGQVLVFELFLVVPKLD